MRGWSWGWVRPALLTVTLLWLLWQVGPWLLVAGGAALAVPGVRHRLRPAHPWRLAGGLVAVVLVVAGVLWLLPGGLLPIPPGTGALVTPSYAGRPATARPLDPSRPGAGPSGPLGDQPQVASRWWGPQRCPGLAVSGADRLVALCRPSPGGDPVLRVADAGSLRVLAAKRLPAQPGDEPCGDAFALDRDGRVLVATGDRHLLVVHTRDGAGTADLTTDRSLDLTSAVPADDCLVGLSPDGRRGVWWVSRHGRVGLVDPATGRTRATALREDVTEPLTLGPGGAAYAVTDEALYRLGAVGGRPTVSWRTAYDRGSRRKPGQLAQGSGSAPVLLPGGLVAITDNADPRMDVVMVRAADGQETCRAGVFEDDHGAAGSGLVGVGSGVVVANTYGRRSPLSTVLGRGTTGGLARVDSDCRVRWTADVDVPSVAPAVSPATGIVYCWTKRPSWWGVDGWYLTAVDARSGHVDFAVRGGLGALFDGGHSRLVLGPGGAAYVATLGGLVRVQDRSDQG